MFTSHKPLPWLLLSVVLSKVLPSLKWRAEKMAELFKIKIEYYRKNPLRMSLLFTNFHPTQLYLRR